jgi:hypothetical protein
MNLPFPHKMTQYLDQLNNNYQIFKEENFTTDSTILCDFNTISLPSSSMTLPVDYSVMR